MSKQSRLASQAIAVAVAAASAFAAYKIWHLQPGPPTWKEHLYVLGALILILVLGVMADNLWGKRKVSKAERREHKHDLSPMFSVLWLVWAGFVLLYEVLTPRPTSPSEVAIVSGMWTITLMAFLVFELSAAKLEQVGDTLSEAVWALLHDEPERGVLAMGFAWLLLIRLVEIGQPGQLSVAWLGGANLGRLLLALGVGGWLTLHWAVAEWKKVKRDASHGQQGPSG